MFDSIANVEFACLISFAFLCLCKYVLEHIFQMLSWISFVHQCHFQTRVPYCSIFMFILNGYIPLCALPNIFYYFVHFIIAIQHSTFEMYKIHFYLLKQSFLRCKIAFISIKLSASQNSKKHTHNFREIYWQPSIYDHQTYLQ